MAGQTQKAAGVAKHRGCLAEESAASGAEAGDVVDEPQGAMAQRRQDHHALVHEMLAQGASFRQIARHLGWKHQTVSAYAGAATWQEMMVVSKQRASQLDRFKPYLSGRSTSGCLKASVLHREVVAQGFAGSNSVVRRFVEQHRARPDLRAIPKPLSTRRVTGWTCRHPDNLTDRDTTQLAAILGNCRELPFSSGPVEGNVNRIKMLKRQMYGRASFDLLRKRVLLAG